MMYYFSRSKLKTYHDVIPISCLTEFPNVVQMAKVRADVFIRWDKSAYKHVSSDCLTLSLSLFYFKLVCEEVNVDRFYPVLYPKVRYCVAAAVCVTENNNNTKYSFMFFFFTFTGIKTYCHF